MNVRIGSSAPDFDAESTEDHIRFQGDVLGAAVVMHRESAAPFTTMRLDDGDMLAVGKLRLQAIHTPGHSRDSMCLLLEDRIFTGDTLLIGATGRTDLSGGDPGALYDSLFEKILKLDPTLKAVVPFMSLAELRQRVSTQPRRLIVLDVRERSDFDCGHITGARHVPRGQLELRVNNDLPDPTMRIVVYCEFGKISTLAAATLRQLGFAHAVALDGGMKAWRDAGYPVEQRPSG